MIVKLFEVMGNKMEIHKKRYRMPKPIGIRAIKSIPALALGAEDWRLRSAQPSAIRLSLTIHSCFLSKGPSKVSPSSRSKRLKKNFLSSHLSSNEWPSEEAFTPCWEL